MNAQELKMLQAPFKERYRQDAASAQVTLTASGEIDLETLTCKIDHKGGSTTRAGLHPLTGGDGRAACAAEMLLEALVGCAGVTFAAVATTMELPVRAARVVVEGFIDFRGTLGVNREVPVGFQSVQLKFEISSEADDEKLSKAVQLAERYCVVAQTLKTVTASWSRSNQA